jgi:hypothetical protein
MKVKCQARHTRSANLFLAAVFAAALIGCGKKSNEATTPSAAGGTATPAAEPILTAWQQGNQSAAVSSFVEADWSKRPLFTPGSTLSLSEGQFLALSMSEREEKSKEMLPQLSELKSLANAVVQAGHEAAARNDAALARKHFTALQQFGAAIDTEESMQIVRLVGRAVKKLGDDALAKLGP